MVGHERKEGQTHDAFPLEMEWRILVKGYWSGLLGSLVCQWISQFSWSFLVILLKIILILFFFCKENGFKTCSPIMFWWFWHTVHKGWNQHDWQDGPRLLEWVPQTQWQALHPIVSYEKKRVVLFGLICIYIILALVCFPSSKGLQSRFGCASD